MANDKIISADTHIVEPPDIYAARIDPKLRDEAPVMRKAKTEDGRDYDGWFYNGEQVATVGVAVQTGRRFEDPSTIDWVSPWEEVPRAAYDPHEMVKALAEDGIWGALLQPSIGLVWWRLPDSELLTGLCRAYNDWMADFVKPYPGRLKGFACLNLDDIDEAIAELDRCAKMGLAGAMIPVNPPPEETYMDERYERLWAAAQDARMPLNLHLGTGRAGPGGPISVTANTAMGRATNDYWVRVSLAAIIFAGVFDRYPQLCVGSVEHEVAWIPHWINQMDFAYRERRMYTGGWTSKSGLLPSEFWKRNMFATFIDDFVGVKMRDYIGVDNIMWGTDYPHAESSWPKSLELFGKMFEGASEEDKRKASFENASRTFGFA